MPDDCLFHDAGEDWSDRDEVRYAVDNSAFLYKT